MAEGRKKQTERCRTLYAREHPGGRGTKWDEVQPANVSRSLPGSTAGVHVHVALIDLFER